MSAVIIVGRLDASDTAGDARANLSLSQKSTDARTEYRIWHEKTPFPQVLQTGCSAKTAS